MMVVIMQESSFLGFFVGATVGRRWGQGLGLRLHEGVRVLEEPG
jgi:hypothetical protein